MSRETLTCEHCGGKFLRPSPKGAAPKYCSQSHRQRAWEVRRMARAVAVIEAVQRYAKTDRNGNHPPGAWMAVEYAQADWEA